MSITQQLERQIAVATETSRGVIPARSMLAISDAAARQLSEELAQMQQYTKPTTTSDLYQSMKAGTARFMDWPIEVAVEGPHDPDAG